MSRSSESKIISDGSSNIIGANIRRIRKEKGLKMPEMIARLQLYYDLVITRECLVKIESGTQHIKLSQLRAIRAFLDVSYEDLLDPPAAQAGPAGDPHPATLQLSEENDTEAQP